MLEIQLFVGGRVGIREFPDHHLLTGQTFTIHCPRLKGSGPSRINLCTFGDGEIILEGMRMPNGK